MKYAKYQASKVKPAPAMHPVWRGIGCVLWVLDPIMAYAFAYLTVGGLSKRGMIPQELLGYVTFPDWVLKTPTLNIVARFIGGLKDLWAMLIFFFVFVVILAGIFIFAYMTIYRFVGPPRYTSVDAPPKKRKFTGISR